MIIFPYRADVDLKRLPVLTLLVCAVCIWVFARQANSMHAYENAVEHFCSAAIPREDQLILRYLSVPEGTEYCEVLLKIHYAPDRNAAIQKLAQEARATPFYPNKSDSADYIYATLDQSSRRFESAIPRDLTAKLHFDPAHPTVKTMLTASFSHGSWWHLISNLVFFFAFAASVEVIAGYLYFVGFIVLSAVGTHVAYRYSVAGLEHALPTVGLSGVVMAMMAFLATIMPTLSIRCFFWFLIFIRTFRVPALAIAALYIVENIYDFVHRASDSDINYMAHISGAAIGVAMGLIYRLRHSERLTALARG